MDGSEIPGPSQEITVSSSIPEHARRSMQERLGPLNRAISSGDLSFEVASLVLSMPEQFYDIPADVADQATDLLAPALGLPESMGIYDGILRTKDAKAAMTLARFGMDPRAAIHEYDTIPWAEIMAEYRPKNWTTPLTRPRFVAFTDGVAAMVFNIKAAALHHEASRIMDSTTFNPRTGEYVDPEDQRKFETITAISQIAEDKPVDFPGVSQDRWHDFQVKNLGQLATTRQLHGNSVLIPDLHDTIVDLSRVRGGRYRLKASMYLL